MIYEIKQLFQIQELHSMACFIENHSDKTYANVFTIYYSKYIAMFLFGVILSVNLQ